MNGEAFRGQPGGQLGRLYGCPSASRYGSEEDVIRVLEDFAGRLKKPAAAGFPFGRHPANLLPLGAWAELSAGPGGSSRLLFQPPC